MQMMEIGLARVEFNDITSYLARVRIRLERFHGIFKTTEDLLDPVYHLAPEFFSVCDQAQFQMVQSRVDGVNGTAAAGDGHRIIVFGEDTGFGNGRKWDANH